MSSQVFPKQTYQYIFLDLVVKHWDKRLLQTYQFIFLDLVVKHWDKRPLFSDVC